MDPKLYKAATSGDVGLLERVANAGTRILHSKAPQENTALHIAARHGHAAFTSRILQLCSQLMRTKNSDDDTALHCAARAGCLEIVQLLMDFESSTMRTADHDDLEEEGGSSSSVGLLRIQNREGNTALHGALGNRKEDVAIKMVRADPKLSFIVNDAKESSFLVAAKEEMVGFVKEILPSTNPASLNITSDDCVIPITAEPLTTEELRELIKIQDDDGRTALHYAAWRNNAEIVGMILEIDSRHVPYMVDNNGCSPLHAPVAFGKKRSFSELLKYCPDTIEQVDSCRRNVVHIALLSQRFEIIRKLLELSRIGGLLDCPDKEGKTPVHLASRPGTHSRLVIKKKAKLEDNKETWIKRGGADFRARHQRMPLIVPKKKVALRRRETQQQVSMLIASLIATVSFAAAFTLPGGYRSSSDPNPGTAILARKSAFKAFVLLDTLAMSFSISAIFLYTSAWGPKFVQGKPEVVVFILIQGNRFTCIACICMLIAMSAGVFAAVSDESMGLAVTVIVISCLLSMVLLVIMIILFFLRFRRSIN